MLDRAIVFAAIVAVGTAHALSGSAPPSAVEGYVTNLHQSPSSFELGKTTVMLNTAARCLLVTLSPARVAEAYATHKTFWTAIDQTRARDTVDIPCGHAPIAIGSFVHLTGDFIKSGDFVVSEMTLYRVEAPNTLHGVALLQEEPDFHDISEGHSGILWISGYPLRITAHTKLFSVPGEAKVRYHFGSPPERPNVSVSVVGKKAMNPGSASLLTTNALVEYEAVEGSNSLLDAKQIRVWQSKSDEREGKYLRHFAQNVNSPDYSRHIEGSIQYGNPGSGAITIVPDKAIQNWIAKLGGELLPRNQYSSSRADLKGDHVSFYVVKPFPAVLGSYFVAVDRTMPCDVLQLRDKSSREFYPEAQHTLNTDRVVATPDGKVLIPDTILPRLKDSAQLSALLACGVTSITQSRAYHSWPAFIVPNGLERNTAAEYAISLSPVVMFVNDQILRIGLRQMYLAGYDIREAPFAGSIGAGGKMTDPVMNLDFRNAMSSWYTMYAFSYIGRYYSDVDYSKLHRGAEEYANFLRELQKADPSAFSAAHEK